jgi:predicted RNase H-like nuclease
LARRPGPELPYSVIAGVTQWGRRWVVASAKINGSNFAPEPPLIYTKFSEVLDERPAFSIIVVNVPIGYIDRPGMGQRTCDLEARAILKGRSRTIRNAPTRATLSGEIPWTEDNVDAITATQLPSIREVAAEMAPYRQRVVYEGDPELSFYQLNKDTPLSRSKRLEAGRDERREALKMRVPGIEMVLDAELGRVPRKHLFDAAALLWSARRVFGHAAKRLPSDAEWDSEGLRMEIIY